MNSNTSLLWLLRASFDLIATPLSKYTDTWCLHPCCASRLGYACTISKSFIDVLQIVLNIHSVTLCMSNVFYRCLTCIQFHSSEAWWLIPIPAAPAWASGALHWGWTVHKSNYFLQLLISASIDTWSNGNGNDVVQNSFGRTHGTLQCTQCSWGFSAPK